MNAPTATESCDRLDFDELALRNERLNFDASFTELVANGVGKQLLSVVSL
jgi:hypothetical protein